jgi:SHS family lactate transporter-like MFS transporter
LFFIGGLPALLTLYVRTKVPESEAWQAVRPKTGAIIGAIRRNLRSFIYVVVLMTMMNLVSHGTQDMYPTFLKLQRGFDPRTVAIIAVIYNVGALLGGLLFGWASDVIGRRRAMVTAVLLAMAVVPLWIYGHSLVWLTIGAFLMQFMVQGAWGAIPAHLIELSPAEVRGLFSGLAYQLGVLFAANAAFVEALIAQRLGYASALALVASFVLAGDVVVIWMGHERRGADLRATMPL